MEPLHRERGRGRRLLRKYRFILIPVTGLFLISITLLMYLAPWKQFTNAHASSLTQIPGHVPALVAKSRLLGPTDAAQSVTLMVGLHLRNQSNLAAYINNSHQDNTSVKGTLSADQVAKAYGPLPDSQQAVITYMQQQGFTQTTSYKHHMLLGFSGTIGEAEAAFHVQINNYLAPGGATFYAPATDPAVPDPLGSIIQSVEGLDTAAHLKHPPIIQMKPTQLASQSALQGQASCPVPTGASTPAQLDTAYNLNGLYNAGYRGEGQSVALFELDDYSQNDINMYTACYGGGSVPIKRIQINGGSGPLGAGAAEVELDMELILNVAPHLASLRVYEAPNDAAGVLAEWSQIVSDGTPVVSTSWGTCEANVTPAFAQQENSLFMVAAAQGQSIFSASGDSGTNDCFNNTLAVDDPASQPYITGVGGTDLHFGTGNTYGSENAWNDGNSHASGGGVSSYWTMPSWQQQGPNVVQQGYSSTTTCAAQTGNTGKYCRQVPDVSLLARPASGYVVYCSVGSSCTGLTWVLIGGTSAGAPMWAGMLALANQRSLHDGYFNLGYVNPLLYQLSTTSYANDFHDAQGGNNNPQGPGSTGPYPCTTGYDMVTGLGSYNAFTLSGDLETLAASKTSTRNAPANTTWYFAEGSVGNSFQEYLTLLNPSATQTATVTITYMFEKKAAVVRQHTVSPSTRATISANGDLGVAITDPQQAISTIVQSNVPIVAERPMYFNLHGIASGTDTIGATHASNTTFYFAEGDTRQDSTRTYYTYVTMLNPSTTQTAHVTLTYYSGGSVVGSKTISIGPLMRGTETPVGINLFRQVAIKVTSDLGIVAERPLYFKDNIATAGGFTTGAASAVGATTLGGSNGSDWLFAEGFTGTRFQEYLVLANFTSNSTVANVKLEYANGTTQTVPVTVNGLSQNYFDVNNASAHPVAGCGCTPTAEVSAEVTSSSASIVAERLMYFHFGGAQISGGTDAVGEAGPAQHGIYAFAEGYTYGSFSEFLTLQNPTNSNVTVAITLFADNTVIQQMKQLPPHSRTTVSVNSLIGPMASAYPTNPVTRAYEVSMDIQALNGTIVAERPMYFNWHGDPGGTDVIGYTGG